MDEKELKQKWNDLGYEWYRNNSVITLSGIYSTPTNSKNIKFYTEDKGIFVSSRMFAAHIISKEELDLINKTVEWLGWAK